jgi:RNA polymerase sigma factor (sigma-70 family)
VRGCRAGHAEAWGVLVARYQRLVYGIAVRAGLDADLCGETFQRVFLLLFEHLERIEQPDRIRAWLVTTTSREARRMRLRQLREPSLALHVRGEPDAADAELGPADQAPLPDEVLLELEQRHLVRDAVASLDPRCRELLRLLFYRSDVPAYAELAAALGTSEGSIGPTRARCLDKLRRRLESAGFGVVDQR